MWALPYQRVVAPSRLSAEELARHLTEQIEPPRCLRWPWDRHVKRILRERAGG